MKYSFLAVALATLILTACDGKKHPMDKPPPSASVNVNQLRILTNLISLRLRELLVLKVPRRCGCQGQERRTRQVRNE